MQLHRSCLVTESSVSRIMACMENAGVNVRGVMGGRGRQEPLRGSGRLFSAGVECEEAGYDQDDTAA